MASKRPSVAVVVLFVLFVPLFTAFFVPFDTSLVRGLWAHFSGAAGEGHDCVHAND
jgi:hypothetical protein